MRTWLVVALMAACACNGGKSKLDVDRVAEVDALWDLAPDGAELGIVASPHAVELLARGLDAIGSVAASSDFAPLQARVEALTAALLGTPKATLADAGLTTTRGFAMFVTTDGVIAVMPVADRDKFMASKHGTRGSGSEPDHLPGTTCKPVNALYVCASTDNLFERIGKASLRGKVALAGGRGDLEVFAPKMPLFGGTPGDLALAVELTPGQISVRGKWTGTPGGSLAKLSGVIAPKVEASNTSGFLALDLLKLLDGLPPIPLAGGITIDVLAKSLKGPIAAVIPGGSVDIQVQVPLTDAAPAKTVVDHCKELATVLDLTELQPPGVCRFRMQSASALELEAWVDNAALHIGAHKDAPAKGTGEPTAFGRELAKGDWSAMFWGRGTMLNLTGIVTATAELPPASSAAIHAISLVNELGAAIKIDKDGVTLRGLLRTAWANPPDVIAKVIAISGDDIVHGKGTGLGKDIAAGAPGSPFATDYAAGQGGLMMPAAALGIASALVIPAIDSILGGEDGPPGDEPPMPPPE